MHSPAWIRHVARLLIVGLLANAVGMPAAQAQNLPNLGDTERAELSPQMERKLGERIMSDLRRDPDFIDDPALVEYLNNLGARLLAARPESRGEAGYDFEFFGVRDASLNAFAMPGGFIGVHTGLLLAAQSESELASVLAHEIGHVSQRHIARMLGSQRQDSLIPLASILLALLAARSNPNLSSAAMMGGQGLAIQRQLNFSREAEREADRVGLQILRDGGFDTSGMATFFGRLQSASRAYSDTAPAYLRTHPLTTERIADIQARLVRERYRQHLDSRDFHFIRARARVLQDQGNNGLRESAAFFETQLAQAARLPAQAARYGLALIALRQNQPERAQKWLDELQASFSAQERKEKGTAAVAMLGVDVAMARKQPELALNLADSNRQRYPLSRGVAAQYADALLANGRSDDAVRFLRDQAQLYRQEAPLQQKLARAYALQGKQALQHLALAEFYALSGSLPSALEQLTLARSSPDASFYDQSIIDARERTWKAQRLEEMRESGAQDSRGRGSNR